MPGLKKWFVLFTIGAWDTKMKNVIVIFSLVVLMAGCGGGNGLHTEPAEDLFFETTRFIMTKMEKEIYKHLPDREAKEAFIEEFWQKRDPSPGTGVNENRLEYERRLEFADRWFKEKPNGRGWDSDRGRILLLLGFPDYRDVRVTTAYGTTRQVNMEEWKYYNYNVVIQFTDDRGLGQFDLNYWPPGLRSAMDRAAFVVDIADKKSYEKAFRFNVKYKDGYIVMTVPVDKIQFEENGGKMEARFQVEVFIYRDFKKIGHMEPTEKRVSMAKEEILKRKSIDIKIPYSLSEKGKYSFDVILKDRFADSRYRNTCSFKN